MSENHIKSFVYADLYFHFMLTAAQGEDVMAEDASSLTDKNLEKDHVELD